MKRNSRRGFFILFGYRTITRSDGTEPVQTQCPSCRESTTIHGKMQQRWFTLFFLPVAPIQTRDSCPRFTQCAMCKQCFNLTIEQFGRKVNAVSGNDHSGAIQMFNDLRDDPANGQKLLKLIQLYAALNEPRDAEVACRAFPAAFNAEPGCAEAMRRLAPSTR